MNIKSKMLMMMAMSGMFLSSTPPNFGDIKEEDIESLNKRIAEHRKRQLLKNGCQEFNFGEVTILALNKKNAERKYQKYLKMKRDETN